MVSKLAKLIVVVLILYVIGNVYSDNYFKWKKKSGKSRLGSVLSAKMTVAGTKSESEEAKLGSDAIVNRSARSYGYGRGYEPEYYDEKINTSSTPLGFLDSGNPVDFGNNLVVMLGGTTTTTPKPDQPAGNFDRYLDMLLVNVAKIVKENNLDPLKVKRFMQCRNCTIQGISLARRGGPANLNYVNRSLVIDAVIHLPAVYISCFPCTQVVLTIPITVMAEIALWDVLVYFKLTQKIERNASPVLDEYKVLREGELDVEVHNYSWMAPLVRVGFKVAALHQIANTIRETVYETIPSFIQSRLKGFSLPFGK